MRELMFGIASILAAALYGQPSASIPSAAVSGSVLTVPAAELFLREAPPPLTYPALASLLGVEGAVVLTVDLDKSGNPVNVQAKDGPGLLRSAAEEYLRSLRFKPYLIQGAGKPVRTEFELPFRLSGADTPRKPVTTVALEIACPAPREYFPFNREAIVREVQAWTGMLHLPEVMPEQADPEGTLAVIVDLTASKIGGRYALCIVQTRCARWVDRHLSSNPQRGTPKVIFGGHGFGERPGGEFQMRCLNSVRKALEEIRPHASLKTIGSEKEKVETLTDSTREDTTGGRPPSTPARPVTDFEFQNMKVVKQPRPPRYPTEALLRKIQGSVVIQMVVSREGKPEYVELLEGPMDLLETAVAYGMEWEFQPAILNGIPVESRFRLRMPFALR